MESERSDHDTSRMKSIEALVRQYEYDSLEEFEQDLQNAEANIVKYTNENKVKKKADEQVRLIKLKAIQEKIREIEGRGCEHSPGTEMPTENSMEMVKGSKPQPYLMPPVQIPPPQAAQQPQFYQQAPQTHQHSPIHGPTFQHPPFYQYNYLSQPFQSPFSSPPTPSMPTHNQQLYQPIPQTHQQSFPSHFMSNPQPSQHSQFYHIGQQFHPSQAYNVQSQSPHHYNNFNPIPPPQPPAFTQQPKYEITGKRSVEKLTARIHELSQLCGISEGDDIDEEIKIIEDMIAQDESEDYKVLLNNLKQLKKVISDLQELNSEIAPKSEQEILREQLQAEIVSLQIAKIEDLEQQLAGCRKQINVLKKFPAKKAQLATKQQRESRLANALDIVGKIQALSSEVNQREVDKVPAHNVQKASPLQSQSPSKPPAVVVGQPKGLPSPTKPKDKYIVFAIQEGETKKIRYDSSTEFRELLKHLGIEESNPESRRFEISLREAGKSVAKILSSGLVSSLFKSESDLEGELIELISVKSANEERYFKKGTSFKQIKKDMDAKGCTFFNVNNLEINEEELYEPATVLYCEEIKVLFKEKNLNKKMVPLNIAASSVVKYLDVKGPETLHISKIKVDGMWLDVDQDKTLQQISKANTISDLRLCYFIDLSIEVIMPLVSRSCEMRISSGHTIQTLKEKFQADCKFKAKFQKWILNGKELEGDTLTFESMEDTNENNTRYRVEVEEILNLEYYGFSHNIEIPADRFREYYIENDKDFVDKLDKGEFPSATYEFSFRVMALGVIFAAVKKHCRIEFAINSIRQLVNSSKKKKESLWKAKLAREKSFFNEHYALHNILHSGDNDLKIEFMRIYKSHSPLPLVSNNENNLPSPFYEHHFWISIKSYTIVSLSLEFEGVAAIDGKSTFLNRIFRSDFELRENRHPICDNAVYIQYNIYRSEKLVVDLVDISNKSLTNDDKVQYCQAANILILHYIKSTEKEVREWVKLNCPKIPVIFVERGSYIMDVTQNFDVQITANEEQPTQLNYGIPELDADNLRHFSRNINVISDQIHLFIRNKVESASNDEKWRFMKFLATKAKKKSLDDFILVLKEVEENFADVVDSETIFMKSSSASKALKSLSPTLEKIIKSIDIQYIDRYMSKLRESIRITRASRLRVFSELTDIFKMLESRNESTIKQKIPALDDFFNRMDKIPASQTSLDFRKNVEEYKGLKEGHKTAENIKKIMEKLGKAFSNQIRPREFSIENFWRGLAKFFRRDGADESNPLVIRSAGIYVKEFTNGRTFEVINGETLQMPIGLLRSNLADFGDTKRIMVIGIFGPQSSGKSTLLNFLFGCDFLSSDGRCTSGVYGTYYEISNRNINNCHGVFLLDTEGLFSNYKNEECPDRKNFDNKLILFLLKTCDILIMNTRGDVDKNCENILGVSFDCELMRHKTGARYPNFYMVLNQSAKDMNDQQIREVQELRSEIVKIAPQMGDYIASEKSNSMPLAFNTTSDQSSSKVLKQLQQAHKTPTEVFYNCTKELSYQLMEILEARGKDGSGRRLCDIYDEMDQVWSTILKIPMLTNHASRKLKEFDDEVTQWRFDENRKMEELVNNFKNTIPIQLRDLDEWEKKKKAEIELKVEDIRKRFNQKYPQGQDVDRNIMIKVIAESLGPKLLSYWDALRIEIASNRYKMEIKQSGDRGLDYVCQVAQQLRQECFKGGKEFSAEEKENQFTKAWSQCQSKIREKLDRTTAARQIYRQMCELYGNTLKCRKQQYRVHENSSLSLNQRLHYDDYARQVTGTISHQSQSETYLFKDINITPIICTPRSGPTDITFTYLDMRKFFEFEKASIFYYFKAEGLYYCIDQQALKTKLVDLISNQRYVQDFLFQLSQELGYFQIKVDVKHYVAKELLKKATKSYEQNWFNNNDIKFKQHTSIQIVQDFYSRRRHFTIARLKELYESIESEAKKYRLNSNSIKYIFHTPICNAINQFIRSCSDQWLNQVLSDCYDPLNQQTKMCFQALGVKTEVELRRRSIKAFPSGKQPIPIKSKNDLEVVIDDSFPSYIRRKEVKNALTSVQDINAIRIAQIETQKIKLHRDYEREPVLRLYLNKQYSELLEEVRTPKFKKFVHKYIDSDKIVLFIVDMIRRLSPEISIQASIEECLLKLNKQIEDFNKDLQQISQELSYSFVSDLHDICLHLLWKWHESRTWQKREEILKDFQMKKANQYSIFMGFLDTNHRKNSESHARHFLEKYVEFITTFSKHEKGLFISRKSEEFLRITTRDKVQELIDADMGSCTSQETAYQYLVNPESFLERRHKTLIEDSVKELNTFASSSVVCLKELHVRIIKILEDIRGDEEKWFSDQLFEENPPYPKKAVKDIFLQLFQKGVQINSGTSFPDYKLKKGITFKLSAKLTELGNIEFFRTNTLPNLEILNYSLFISSLNDVIEEEITELPKKVALLDSDKENFREQVKLILCPRKCDCCKRLCDVDMKIDSLHKIHRCKYGHQMRAVNGIRVEKREKGTIQLYASVRRCEDIEDTSPFEFNTEMMTWKVFCDRKKAEWSFEKTAASTNEKQRLMFANIWKLAGKRICAEKIAADKTDMIYLDYDEAAIKFTGKSESGSAGNCQYAIAIDGSGSMTGQKWADQLKSLKEILRDLSGDPTNRVSIVVFTDDPNIIYENAMPSTIDVNTIRFPSGATVKEAIAAFTGGATVLRKYCTTMNMYFAYLSDGHGTHPAAEIQAMLEIKRTGERHGRTFKYCSILIGGDLKSSGMGKINESMKGESKWVNSAADIGFTFREILKTQR